MIRAIADILGLEITFDPATSTARFVGYDAQNRHIVLEIPSNSNTMRVNGVSQPIRATAGVVPSIIRGDRMFVPVLVFSDVFNVQIGWNADSATITVNPPI